MTAYSLRQLEAKLQKVVAVTTSEIGADGKYVFRDADGKAFMWGPGSVRYEYHDVASIAEADHLMFLCPKCFEKNGGSSGTHRVLVTFAGRNVPDDMGSCDSEGKPSRWTIQSGTTLDDLVLTPSILLDAKRPPDQGCHWHGFVGTSGIAPGHVG